VTKVGPKTAVKWIAEHGSLDGVIAAADRIGGVVGENLRAALPWLATARELVTIGPTATCRRTSPASTQL
jgi:DNA polymerase-1